MRRHGCPWLVILGAAAGLSGCGSVQQVILDSVRDSAREAIEETVDEAVDGIVDDLADRLPDFDGLLDEEGSVPQDGEEHPE